MKKKGVTIGPKQTDIPKTKKTDVTKFNAEEVRGWVIDELNTIEEKVNRVITNYFKPQERQAFITIVLNTSIVSTGAKLKILRNIDGFDKNLISKIQNVLSTRNAFAHLPITKSAQASVKMIDDKLVWKLESVTSQLDIMNSSGEIKKKNVKDLIQEYKSTVKVVNDYLDSFVQPAANTR